MENPVDPVDPPVGQDGLVDEDPRQLAAQQAAAEAAQIREAEERRNRVQATVVRRRVAKDDEDEDSEEEPQVEAKTKSKKKLDSFFTMESANLQEIYLKSRYILEIQRYTLNPGVYLKSRCILEIQVYT